MKLSRLQQQIVIAPISQSIQILASAGAGKTRVLTERIGYILQETKTDCVIALTFTNKAADEMKIRLSNKENIEDRVWFATIHSIAQRILEKYGHTIGLPSELHIYDREQDKMEIFIQSLRDDGIDIDDYLNVADTRELKNRERKLHNIMEIFSKIKRDLLTEIDIENLYPQKKIWKIYQDYQKALLRSGGIDYDDILVYAYRILVTHESIAKIYRAQFKHICVDEAQDLNNIQYKFIKAFCGDAIKSVFMVGDPNQMIYGFNGSSNEYLCKSFVEDFKPAKFILKENYRSSKAVIRLSNRLKENSQQENEFALQGQSSIKGFSDEKEEANAIIIKVKQLINMGVHPDIEGEITLDKIVVIARNRFVFKYLEEKLKEEKIIYSIRKGERQLEPSTLFGKIIDAAIRIKLNPKDWVNGKKLCQLLNVDMPEQWDEQVLFILSKVIKDSQSKDLALYPKLLNAIYQLDVAEPNIPKLIKEFKKDLMNLVSNDQNIMNQEFLEEVRLSIDELTELNDTWTLFKRKGLGDSLLAFRNAIALGQLNQQSYEQGLTLSTVHTMKGLEKEIVFVMGMCEGVFPDYRANTPEDIEEERNNAFVAITRAKRWIYVSYPEKRMMPWGDIKLQRKSRFVEKMEA